MKIEEKEGHLVVVDFNEVDAYKIACKIEKDGKWFYQKIAVGVKDDAVRNALEFLIKEEQKHLEFFETNLADAVKEKGEAFEEDDMLDSMEFDIFQPYQSIDELDNILDDPAKALKMGVAIEEKSVKFYGICRDNISNESAKEQLQKIVEEEQKHKETFEKMLAALVNG